MKKIAIIGLIALLVTFDASARKIKGFIIKDGSTKEVTFNVRVGFMGGEPNFEKLQYRIKYYDESGKKHVLKPEDASEISFEFDGLDVRMISCLNSLNLGNIFSSSERIFLKLELDGPLRLYRYYYTQRSGGMYNGATGSFSPGIAYTVDNLIFQKGNGMLKQPKGIGWKKDMIAYFNDCPALAALIEGKDLKRRDIEAIVMYYNKNCVK